MTADEIRAKRDFHGVIRDQQIAQNQMWAQMEIAALLVEIRDDLRRLLPVTAQQKTPRPVNNRKKDKQ